MRRIIKPWGNWIRLIVLHQWEFKNKNWKFQRLLKISNMKVLSYQIYTLTLRTRLNYKDLSFTIFELELKVERVQFKFFLVAHLRYKPVIINFFCQQNPNFLLNLMHNTLFRVNLPKYTVRRVKYFKKNTYIWQYTVI